MTNCFKVKLTQLTMTEVPGGTTVSPKSNGFVVSRPTMATGLCSLIPSFMHMDKYFKCGRSDLREKTVTRENTTDVDMLSGL